MQSCQSACELALCGRGAYGGCMMCRQDLYRVIGNVAMGQEPESLLPQ